MKQTLTVSGIQLQALVSVLTDYKVEVLVLDTYTKEVLAIVPKFGFMLRILENGEIDKRDIKG